MNQELTYEQKRAVFYKLKRKDPKKFKSLMDKYYKRCHSRCYFFAELNALKRRVYELQKYIMEGVPFNHDNFYKEVEKYGKRNIC